MSIENPFDIESNLDLYVNLKSDSKNTIKLVNSSPYITIDVNLEAAIIGGSENEFDFSSSERLVVIENAAKQYFEENLTSFLYKISKEYNSDIFLLGNDFRKQYLTVDEWHKVHWKEIFKDSFFNVNVNINVTSNTLFMKD